MIIITGEKGQIRVAEASILNRKHGNKKQQKTRKRRIKLSPLLAGNFPVNHVNGYSTGDSPLILCKLPAFATHGKRLEFYTYFALFALLIGRIR